MYIYIYIYIYIYMCTRNVKYLMTHRRPGVRLGLEGSDWLVGGQIGGKEPGEVRGVRIGVKSGPSRNSVLPHEMTAVKQE